MRAHALSYARRASRRRGVTKSPKSRLIKKAWQIGAAIVFIFSLLANISQFSGVNAKDLFVDLFREKAPSLQTLQPNKPQPQIAPSLRSPQPGFQLLPPSELPKVNKDPLVSEFRLLPSDIISNTRHLFGYLFRGGLSLYFNYNLRYIFIIILLSAIFMKKIKRSLAS